MKLRMNDIWAKGYKVTEQILNICATRPPITII